MFLQALMTAARARGLDTCPQAAWLEYHRIIAEVIGMPANETLVCGMSLGYADPDAKINTLQTEREPVSGFATFQGF
jgi:nitroreductase